MPQLHWEPIASGEGGTFMNWGEKKEEEGKWEKYKEQWGGARMKGQRGKERVKKTM